MTPLQPLWPGLTYFKHQVPAIQHMLLLERIGVTCSVKDHDDLTVYGGLLGDDMGLGKTIEMLATLRHNPKPKTLVLVPLALVETWRVNASKAGFCVALTGLSGKTKAWTKDPASVVTAPQQIYLTNYETLLFHKELILSQSWDRVVLDEAHRIRNPETALTEEVFKIKAPIRWAMTGTPVVNRIKDAATLFAFIGVPHSPSMKWLPEYTDLIHELVIHRSMEEIRGIVPDVPPVPEVEEHVVEFLTHKERVFYDTAGLGEIPLVRLLRLRQASVSPATFDPTWKTPSTKMVALGDLIEEGGKKDKWLVFCSFHSEMELISEYLQQRLKIETEEYHGGLTAVERTEALDRAREPSCQVLLIQLQAGGVGLNLQEFNRVVFMSPWWTSAMMDQAVARAVRMGQKRVVKVIHLLIDHEKGMNIDKFMGSKAEEKRKILKQEFFKHRVDLTTKTKTKTKTTSDVPVKGVFLKRKAKA